MNILYCGDGNIAKGVMISLLSLAKNVDSEINVYILTATLKHGSTVYKALEKRYTDYLESVIKIYNPKSSVKLFDITALVEENPPTANLETRFTPCCMLRLYADMVAELPDRILYLDNDVICRRDISSFYNQDIAAYEIVGCLDYYGSWLFKRKGIKRDYINSGVLLLNMAEIRKSGLFRSCIERCANVKMFMPDQTAINKLCRKKKIAPRRFNEQRKLHNDTVMQHFTTSFRLFPWFHAVSVKPWNTDEMHSVLKLFEYDDILNEYKRLNYIFNEKETVKNEL